MSTRASEDRVHEGLRITKPLIRRFSVLLVGFQLDGPLSQQASS